MTPGLLVFGFYGEGPRDYGFLLTIVLRTLQHLLPDVDVLEISLDDLDVSGLSQIDKMKRVAQAAHGYGLVVFHLDADAPNTQRAYTERFEPGYQEILHEGDGFNKMLIPIIPVRMTDAWMLVDFEAFRRVVGTKLTAQELGLDYHPHQVEAIQSPKDVFKSAVENARPGRRNVVDLDSVYKPLAQRISLDRLANVPAYQEFVSRLIEALKETRYIA